MSTTTPPLPEVPDDPPPVLGSWFRVYAAILLYVAVVISLLALLTRAYAP